MTRINKLTQNPELLADDLLVIWDNDNQRTRSVTAETLSKYTDTAGANAQAFVSGYIQDGILYMVRANQEVVNIGSITGVELLAEGSIPKVENGKLVASAVKETDNAVVFTKDIIAPQESVFVGPAVKISDKGGYLGVDNLADDRESTPVISFVYETESERDEIFSDGVSVPRYRYFVPAKWVYQFPFDAEYSNANKLSFEFQDTDNTLIRKFRMFSKKAQSGVRIWIENLLPSGDALVWENVSEDSFNEGNGQEFVAQGLNDQFTLVESGLVKISTANIRFRFNVQAQPGEVLELQGQELDLGFGLGFYPRMVTYTQDEKDLELLDGIETSQNRFGQFGEQFRIETSDIVARDLGAQSEDIVQGVFDTAITTDRPEAIYQNGAKPIQINAITVKHIGTWSPVQVSLNDDRTQVVDFVDGDNTITFAKPLTVEANQSVYFRFTGAVGTGSQTQISLLGDAQQEIYYKLDITELEEKTVTVNGVESVVAGNKISVDDSDPKNPIVSWDPSGDLLPGVNINKDGAQVLSAADTLNFSGSFDVVKAKDTGGTVNIEIASTARGSNYVGLFADTSELTTKYPNPEDGLYAEVLQGNGELPDDRYESKGGSWIGMGGVAGQVIVDGAKTAGLIIGDGLKSTEDGGSKTISTSGKVNIVELDVDADPTITLDSSYAGKLISITQSSSTTAKVMVITLSAYDSFSVGDTITIARSEEYINHYFTVYYSTKNGQQRALYPARNVTFIATSKGWDFTKDGANPKFSEWPVINVGIGDSPKSINGVDDVGYEYVFNGSQFSQSVLLYDSIPEGSQIKVTVDDYTSTDKPVEVSELKSSQRWYITTPTVFIYRNNKWRVEESSQMLHIAGSTTFIDNVPKAIVNAIASDPSGGINSEVNEQGILVLSVDDEKLITKDGGEVKGRLDVTPVESGYTFTVNKLDESPLLTAFTGDDGNVVGYRKSLRDYEENSTPFDLVNMLYANSHYVKQGGGFVAGDIVVMQKSAYVLGGEFITDVDYFHYQTGTTISCGDIGRDSDGNWTGDFIDFAHVRDDHIEFKKLAAKDFYVYDESGNTMIHSNPSAKATTFNNFVEFKQSSTYKGATDGEYNIINRKALNEALSGGLSYSGEGESIPNRRLVSTGSLLQEKVSDQFTNNQNTSEDFYINLDESLTGAVTYINGGNIPSRRFVVRDNKTSRTSSRTIRAGESWVCHSFLPGDFNTTNFEWFRLDTGASAQFVASDWLGAQRYAIISDNVTCFKPNNHFEIRTDGGSALRISFNDDLEYGELRLKCTKGANDYKFVTVIAMNGKQSDFKLYPGYDYHIKVSAKENVDIEFIQTNNSLEPVSFRDASVLDKVETVGFDDPNSTVTEIRNVEDIKYRIVDLPTRINKEGTVNIFLDSSKPIGALQIDNVCNYNGDYPELVIMLYVDSTSTSLGGFRIPYGLGATLKYNLDNKEINNYKNGYWTWDLSVIDWSILRKVSQAGILDQVDVSGFDAEPLVKSLYKKFTNTDLITIPLILPVGFSVMVRQVLVKRSSGVELDMDFTYKYDGSKLQIHLNEVGTGFLLAGIIKDEI